MTETEKLFHKWNAIRLKITFDESVSIMDKSRAMFRGGFGGKHFNKLVGYVVDVYQAIHYGANDAIGLYQDISTLMLLRQLSYPDPVFGIDNPVVGEFRSRKGVSILDFGCGLAQISRAVAKAMVGLGIRVTMTFSDVHSLREDFIKWAAMQDGIEKVMIVPCTSQCPVPRFPPCDLAIAFEVFEHIHDNIPCLKAIDDALLPGGLLWGTFEHRYKLRPPCHVNSNSSEVVAFLSQAGYRRLGRGLYKKKGT